VGTLISGAYWEEYSPQIIFGMAAIASFVGLLLALKFKRLDSEETMEKTDKVVIT